jgi:hypothetical protein
VDADEVEPHRCPRGERAGGADREIARDHRDGGIRRGREGERHEAREQRLPHRRNVPPSAGRLEVR